MVDAHKAAESLEDDEIVAQLQHFDGTLSAGHTRYFLY